MKELVVTANGRLNLYKIYGKGLDKSGRCYHYHQDNDIVGLKCSTCQKYFACYKCHDELMSHNFSACDKNSYPVICGQCGTISNFDDYAKGYCSQCQAVFNPKCHLHWEIYFTEN